MIAPHKFRFGVNGDFLRSSMWPRRMKELRLYPKRGLDTWAYIESYFQLNKQFKESSWQ